MDVQMVVQLGLVGKSKVLNPITLDVGSIGSTSSWAGSYHIISMGRHYDDYVITGSLMGLPKIPGIPVSHPYRGLTGKIRAAGVTGNIGEAIAALFVRRYFLTGVDRIAHVKPRRPFRKRKSPDYLMNVGSLMPGPLGSLVPWGFPMSLKWWPMESKARNTTNAARNARIEALMQLATYWSLLANSQPTAVGFGLAAVFKYQPPREVRVNLFVPSHQIDLITELKKGEKNFDTRVIRSCLHGC